MAVKQAKRALIVVRLSRETEASSSVELQKKICREKCEKDGYVVVDVVEDVDVSAATSPWDRPQLGPWLNDRHQDFDVLMVYRADRLVRRVLDLAELIGWSRKHGIVMVSATETHFDLTGDYGDMIAFFIAKVGEMELAAIRARTAGAFQYTVKAGRWRGGTPPWGYIPVRDGKHWKLEIDKGQAEVIRKVVEDVIAGKKLRVIAHELTADGVPTQRDAYTQHYNRTRPEGTKPREVKNYAWHPGPLKRALTSETLLGRAVVREPVLDEDGVPVRDGRGKKIFGDATVVRDDNHEPVKRAAPIIDEETFRRLQAALAGRENRKEPQARSSSLLLGILRCGACDRAAYKLKGGEGRKPRYRCASAQYESNCTNRTIMLHDAEERVIEEVMSRVGRMERTTRVWDPGTDVSAEKDRVDKTLVDLTMQLASGSFEPGTPQREALDVRISDYVVRQRELAQIHTVPPGWRYAGTGETLLQWWEAADLEARNQWLRDSGITAAWRSSTGENSRTVVDSFVVKMGDGPESTQPVLPGPLAGAVEAAGRLRDREPAVADVVERLGRDKWRDGDPLQDVMDGVV